MQNPSTSANVECRRPRPGTRTARVWDLADEITRERGRLAKVGEVRERVVAEGGNPNTANTQYYRWKASRDAAAVAIRQVQARLRRRKRPGESVVDRFLAERRALWGEA